MKKNIWIILTLLSAASCGIVYKYFDRAVPFVRISITMDADEAAHAAKEIANKFNWDMDGYFHAINFSEKGEVQAFVELEGGGKEAYLEMIDKKYHQPYAWTVRFYKPGETKEYFVAFTPDGNPYEFRVKMPECEMRSNLNRQQAEELALQQVPDWNVDFDAYDLIEYHSNTQSCGRVDHEFVYQRRDVTLKEGTYRLKLVVAGDSCTSLSRFIKIPDEFLRRYQEMYSHNTLIATVANNIMIILYVLVFLLYMVIIFYGSKSFLHVRIGVRIFGLFMLLGLLSATNTFPLIWNNYCTHSSVLVFLTMHYGFILINTLMLATAISIITTLVSASDIFMFGRHIQLFKSYSPKVGSSSQILQQTLLAYACALIFLGYEVLYSVITSEYFGWWSPLNRLVDPKALLAYVPAFYPVAMALRVGILEEFLFRGLPLTGIAILTRKSKNKAQWFWGMFVVQALIFGAVHANYVQQPAYNRVIELFCPSLVFAALYYWFGLLPGIVFHGVYDAILFAIPIFASDLLLQKILVISGILLPLLIVLYRWWQQGRVWSHAPETAYNKSIQKPDLDAQGIDNEPREVGAPARRWVTLMLLAIGIAGAACFYVAQPWQFVTPICSTSREQAITIATEKVAAREIDLTQDWTVVAELVNPVYLDGNKFMWQTFGSAVYTMLQGTYVPAPYWVVAWKKFTGPVEDRAEEVKVLVDCTGKVQGLFHGRPEYQAGDHLSEAEALHIAITKIYEWYGIEVDSLQLIECSSCKLSARRDWTIVYKDVDGYSKPQGEATIIVSLAGSKLSKIERKIKAPEQWLRESAARSTQESIIKTVARLLCILILLGALIICLRRVHNFKALLQPIAVCTLALCAVSAVELANNWYPVCNYMNTIEPLRNQLISFFSNMLISTTAFALLHAALMILFVTHSVRPAGKTSTWYHLALLAAGAGLAGLQMLLGSFGSFDHPDTPYLSQLNYLNFPLGIFEFFVSEALYRCFVIVAAVIVAKWLIERRHHVASVMLFLLVGLITVQLESIMTLELWVATGLMSGLIWMFLYSFVLARDTAAVLFLMYGFATTLFLPTVMCKAYEGVDTAFMIGSTVAWILCVKLYQKISQTK